MIVRFNNNVSNACLESCAIFFSWSDFPLISGESIPASLTENLILAILYKVKWRQ